MGNDQVLYPAFAGPATLRSILQGLDASATIWLKDSRQDFGDAVSYYMYSIISMFHGGYSLIYSMNPRKYPIWVSAR